MSGCLYFPNVTSLSFALFKGTEEQCSRFGGGFVGGFFFPFKQKNKPSIYKRIKTRAIHLNYKGTCDYCPSNSLNILFLTFNFRIQKKSCNVQ